MTFGETLRAWREYRGQSVPQFVADVRIPEWQITRIEADQEDWQYLYLIEVYKMAQTLGCTVEDLVEGRGPKVGIEYGPEEG